jgi:hypothetical protein
LSMAAAAAAAAAAALPSCRKAQGAAELCSIWIQCAATEHLYDKELTVHILFCGPFCAAEEPRWRD